MTLPLNCPTMAALSCASATSKARCTTRHPEVETAKVQASAVAHWIAGALSSALSAPSCSSAALHCDSVPSDVWWRGWEAAAAGAFGTAADGVARGSCFMAVGLALEK